MNCRRMTTLGGLAILTAVVLAVSIPSVAAQAQSAVGKAQASPLRTSWGDPDLQGMWTNTTTTPLERPKDLEGKQVLANEEFAERDRQVAERSSLDRAPRAGDPGVYNEFWIERGKLLKRTSLIVEPPDGRLPTLTSAGQKRQADRAEARKAGPADGPESRNVYERCLTRGLPGSMMPGFYNHNYHILQTPQYVVIHVEMIHDARIIPLGGRPHADSRITQWLGDSRGHWEGATLVVETTNLKNVDDRGLTAWGTGGTARVVERFTRVDANSIDYQVTVDDPAMYTKPWTAAIPMTKLEGTLYEYACHEGNYALPGILGGTRAEERTAGKATKQ